MARPSNYQELFSRGASPPESQSQHQLYSNPPHASSTNQIDSLFNNITPSSSQQPLAGMGGGNTYGNSDSTTPNAATFDDPSSTSTSTQNNPAPDRERQNALLNLLGSVSSTNTQGHAGAAATTQPMPQQVPTPPGSSQRSGPSPNDGNTEAQGKILLEQLMSGNPARSNYSDSTRGSLPPSGPSPPYVQPSGPPQRTEDPYLAPYNPHDAPRDTSQRSQQQPQQQQQQRQQQQQQQQPPSPRKSMFDFVSPFDHLAASSSSPLVKKKPVPTQPPSSSSGNEDWTTASVSTDPKRQSMENLLMDQLSRGPAPPSVQAPPDPYEPYVGGGDISQSELLQPRVPPPPLPPKPTQGSPPVTSQPGNNRQPARPDESPVSQNLPPQSSQAYIAPTRQKDSSPGPRGNYKSDGRTKPATGGKGKTQTSPTAQSQVIVFDVSLPLDDVQAPRDAVKSTAIALVKQDSVFLPGTTIGATHWVAYAMTRGRVRVISRSSGDRTLLQLPSTFPTSSAVTDMAVYGNRLAGVTSDGGFVVWELPEVITDDVPGQLLLCVPPATDADALHSVKWHPKQPDTLAIASQTNIYLIDLIDAAHTSRGQPLPHSELDHISQIFSVRSRVIAFDFDVAHYAIATISEDSTLTLWNIRDRLPFWTYKVRGEEIPSSLTFVDGGIVIGRKNGTIFQLLSVTTKNILSTIKFTNGSQEDNDMFGHINYDSRIQTLWLANNRRDSMIACKIGVESSPAGGEDGVRSYFEQVVEFAGPKPTIHFVILTADADPTGDEAHAACIAAKVPPGELALVAFSVHSSGVDQILIRKEWYDSALATAPTKLPPYTLPQIQDGKHRQGSHNPFTGVPHTLQSQGQAAPARMRTPPSEDIEGDLAREEGRLHETKGKGKQQKNVGWKDKEDSKDKNTKSNDATLINESNLGQALSREIRKTEESLHTRIGRLIGKEMDKQHQRLEEARAKEQSEDFARQEKILKLISTELTRNTTRVVEMAVKSEVQNSVLPALENITQIEVKSALNEQIGRGLADFIQKSLPMEIEKLLLRPDISNHFAHVLSSNLTPLIERNIKDVINKTFLPAFTQQTTSMHQELLREIRTEVHNIKTELFALQTDAFRSQESLIRDLEHNVRALSDQVKFLSMNPPSAMAPLHHHIQNRSSPTPNTQHSQGNMNQHPLRQTNIPPVNQGSSGYNQTHSGFQQQSQPSSMPWFAQGIAAPQASHPAAPPPPPPPPPITQRSPPAQSEEWDDTYLAVLGTQDPRQLRELLLRSNPDVVMPMNGPGPLSQAVVLTLLHRLAAAVGETPPVDESFKSSLWWLQRTASTLNTNDPLISPYIARVVPNVQQMLNTTKQRLAIIPGGPQLLDTARTISEVQDTLNRKPM